MQTNITKLGRLLPWLAALALTPSRADLPPELAAALHHLQNQGSYKWEVINGDPGPVAQSLVTRRGTVTTLQQNTSPHILGRLAGNGEIFLQRDWADGLQLDTLVAADTAMITRTPEGWLTTREILTALAEEGVNNAQPTARYSWLKRADRPSVRRPDQELTQFLKNSASIEVSGDAYVVSIVTGNNKPGKKDDADAQASIKVTITVHLSGGVIRTYEVKLEGTMIATSAYIPVPMSDDRIVILTYLPVTKLDVPEEARAKLSAAR
ncbi:MAG: hypothetical protein EXS39_04540 [Opitutaceae bacterium]|nr:hypothetical protein [Opitutaceae bacterium]